MRSFSFKSNFFKFDVHRRVATSQIAILEIMLKFYLNKFQKYCRLTIM